jgi:hypothetical protein
MKTVYLQNENSFKFFLTGAPVKDGQKQLYLPSLLIVKPSDSMVDPTSM